MTFIPLFFLVAILSCIDESLGVIAFLIIIQVCFGWLALLYLIGGLVLLVIMAGICNACDNPGDRFTQY